MSALLNYPDADFCAVQPALPFEPPPSAETPAQPVIPPAPPETRSLRDTAALHREILSRLGPSPLAEDQLIRDLGAPSDRVSPALTDLEIEGRIERRPGGLLSRV